MSIYMGGPVVAKNPYVLLNCPFCGEVPVTYFDGTNHQILCRICGASGPQCRGLKGMSDKWNERVK